MGPFLPVLSHVWCSGDVCSLMMTSSNGNIFSITGPLWEEFTSEFPLQSQWRGALMFFFYLCPSKPLSKQSRNRWFQMPLCPLWHHCNVPRTLERILTRLSYMLQDFIFFTYLISFSILSFSFSRECKFCMGLEHSLFHFLSNQVMVTHWEMDEWGDRKPPYVGIVGTRAGGLTLTVLAFLWLCMAIQMSINSG